MFEPVDTRWRGHGAALRIACTVLLPVAAVVATLGGRNFLASGCVAALAVLFRAYWALSIAGLGFGVGSALTPHRPEFANIGDLLFIVVIFAYGLGAGLILLVPKRTRRAALWLLLGTAMIPAGCFGTAELRDSISRPR